MKKPELDRVKSNMETHDSPMSPDDKQKFEEQLDSIVVSDISPDASLAEIKAKQSEIIQKHRDAFKKYQLRKRELCYLERIAIPAEMHYREVVADSNRGVAPKEKMNKDEQDWRVKKLVASDAGRGTLDIYDKTKELKNRVDVLEGALKNNKMIADRVENMLNAQINLDKQVSQARS